MSASFGTLVRISRSSVSIRRPSAAGRRSWRRRSGFSDSGRPPRIRIRSIALTPRFTSAAGRCRVGPCICRTFGIADLARLVALRNRNWQMPSWRRSRRQRRGVADFDRHLAFPFGLQRGDVHDDAAAGVGGFAEADDQDVARDAEILDGVAEGEAVGRDDAGVGLAVDETRRREFFGSMIAESTLVKTLKSSAMRAS